MTLSEKYFTLPQGHLANVAQVAIGRERVRRTRYLLFGPKPDELSIRPLLAWGERQLSVRDRHDR